VFEGTLASMGIVVVVSVAANAKGTVEDVGAVGPGDTRRAGEVMLVSGVAGVDETETAEVPAGAVEEVEAIGLRGIGDASEVGDAVQAGDDGGVVGESKVVGIVAARVRNSNVATASAEEILAEIQL